MKIVKIWGGIGNQLFQYALFRDLLSRDQECYMDLSWFNNQTRKFWYPCQLECMGFKLQQLPLDSMFNHSEKELEILRLSKSKPWLKWILNPVYRILRKEKCKIDCIYEKTNYDYKEEIYEDKLLYLAGFWQNKKYLENVIGEIKREVHFPKQDNYEQLNYENEIMNSNSVCVHIRRSDYNFEDFDSVCPDSYYFDAIDYIEGQLNNPKFYIFSNKIDKAKEMFGNNNRFVYVTANDRMHGLGDLKLMTLCKHNIISNSTFSWWGAALNKNPEAIVILPKLWRRKNSNLNLILEGWKEI